MADSFNPDDIPDDIVIQVDDLSKHYGELKAVDSISFGVGRGEVFGILGPNGAGKTTTLECIEGLVEPTSGRTSVLGIDTQREPQKVKERIGVQLQASAYFDFLTLKEILDLFGMFYNRRVAPTGACWNRSTLPTGRTQQLPNSQAGSSSDSRLPPHWSTTPRWCS